MPTSIPSASSSFKILLMPMSLFLLTLIFFWLFFNFSLHRNTISFSNAASFFASQPALLVSTPGGSGTKVTCAANYQVDRAAAVAPFTAAAARAAELGLGLNAGHDLDRTNLSYFKEHVPGLLEVSIGHALICDALTFGLENTIQLYQRELR